MVDKQLHPSYELLINFLIGVSEGKKKKKGLEKLFEEIIAENFLNMIN